MTFRFLSIGSDCQVARQLGIYRAANVPQFFDCLRVSVAGVIALIENRFEGMLEYDNLHP